MSSGTTSVGMPIQPAEGLSAIEVRRTRDWFAVWRRLSIRLDGAEAGAVGYGQSTRLSVSPGAHAVRVSLDWGRTPEVVVDLQPGEVAILEVGLRPLGLRWLIIGLEATFWPNKLLYLRRIDDRSGSSPA